MMNNVSLTGTVIEHPTWESRGSTDIKGTFTLSVRSRHGKVRQVNVIPVTVMPAEMDVREYEFYRSLVAGDQIVLHGYLKRRFYMLEPSDMHPLGMRASRLEVRALEGVLV